MSGFARFINSEVALLCELDGEGRPNQISAVGMGAAHLVRRPGEGKFVSRALSLERSAVERLDPVEDAELVKMREPRLTYAATAPVRLTTGVRGALIAGFETAPQDGAFTLWAAEAYAAAIGLCLMVPGALDGLLVPARRDGLTGCLTYDAILDELAREINRSARGGLALSVCFVDLDGFKRVNDQIGHLSGNKVLAQVGGILRDGVRSFDSVGRYGGDEFVAILPQTDERAARALAARLRTLIAAANISPLRHLLTASVGVAGWTPGISGDDVLSRADSALLAAKAQRTGVMAASDASASAQLGGRDASTAEL